MGELSKIPFCSGWNRKEGRGNKDFEKGGKLGQGVGALKRGSWNPLMNYESQLNMKLQMNYLQRGNFFLIGIHSMQG